MKRFGDEITNELVDWFNSVDATYQGGRAGNAGDDPFPRLLGVSNMGGFRYRGSLAELDLVVLTSSLSDPEWPDALDQDTGGRAERVVLLSDLIIILNEHLRKTMLRSFGGDIRPAPAAEQHDRQFLDQHLFPARDVGH